VQLCQRQRALRLIQLVVVRYIQIGGFVMGRQQALESVASRGRVAFILCSPVVMKEL
jgi:hypothetical protein